MRDHFNDACVPVWPLEGSKSLRQRREGIELGNPRYTGHPCRHRGHGAERYTVCGGCVACARGGAERRRLERGAKVRGSLPQARHQCRSERRARARQRRQEESGCGPPTVAVTSPHSGFLIEFLQKVAQPEFSICSKKKSASCNDDWN